MQSDGKVWIIYNAETKAQTQPLSWEQAQALLISITKEETSKYFLWTPGWADWISLKKFLASEQSYFVLLPPKPQLTSIDKHSTVTKIPVTMAGTKEHTAFTDSQTNDLYTHVEMNAKPLRPEVTGGYWGHDFCGDDLDLSKIRKITPPQGSKSPKKKSPKKADAISEEAERRTAKRMSFKIAVTLISRTKSFRTYSKDISLGGTMLEDEIPKEFLHTPFDLIILNPFEENPQKARLLFRAKFVGDINEPRRLMFIEKDPTMTKRLGELLRSYVDKRQDNKKVG
jgi:hypothetical protein